MTHVYLHIWYFAHCLGLTNRGIVHVVAIVIHGYKLYLVDSQTRFFIVRRLRTKQSIP